MNWFLKKQSKQHVLAFLDYNLHLGPCTHAVNHSTQFRCYAEVILKVFVFPCRMLKQDGILVSAASSEKVIHFPGPLVQDFAMWSTETAIGPLNSPGCMVLYVYLILGLLDLLSVVASCDAITVCNVHG